MKNQKYNSNKEIILAAYPKSQPERLPTQKDRVHKSLNRKFRNLSTEPSEALGQKLQHDQQQIDGKESPDTAPNATHADLDKLRQRYLEFFDQAPAGYFTTDARGYILSANLTSANMLGVARERLVSLRFADFIHKEDQNIFCQHRKQLFENGTPQQCEIRMSRQDCEPLWVSLKVAASCDTSGLFICNLAMIDISKYKCTEADLLKRLRHEQLLSRISMMTCEIEDLATFLTECVNAIIKALGVSRVHIFEYRHTGDTMVKTIEAYASGITPQKELQQNIPSDCISSWVDKMKKGQCLIYSNIEDIPDKAVRDRLRKQDILSIMVTPLFVAGRFHGFMGVEECDHLRIWAPEDLTLFQAVGRIIGVTIQRKQKQSILIKSENLFKNAFHNHIAIKLLIDPRDGKIVDANQAASNFYGWSRKQLLKMHIHDINTLPAAEVKQEIERAMAQKKIYFEFSHRRADGSIRDVAVFSSNIAMDESPLLHSIVHDITEARQAKTALEENEISLALAQEVAHIGNWVYEVAENHLTWSDETYRILGLQPKSIPASHEIYLDSVHPEDRKRVEEAYAKTLWGGKKICEIEHRIRRFNSNDIIWVRENWAHQFHKSGKVVRIIGMVQDITQLKLANAARALAEEEKTEAQKCNAAKSAFLANMSHEIRTPMNVIIGMNHLLLDTELDPKQREYIKTVMNAGHSLMQIINDILDLSKIEAEKLELRPIEFSRQELSESLVVFFKSQIKAKNLIFRTSFDPSIPCFLYGDPLRTKQIVMNLLSNALKFTTEGYISYSVDVVRSTGQDIEIRFKVSDSGIGIPNDKMDRIFKPFSQIDDTITRNYGGTGLGLQISNRLIKMMGGHIQVESKVNQGTTFTVVLPFRVSGTVTFGRRNADVESKAFPKDERPNFQNPSVLLVEDHPINRQVISELMEKVGIRVSIAINGREAVDMVRQNNYDLILMDIQMPVLDGYSATQEIRNMNKTFASHLPIIALSAHAMSSDRDLSLQCGMDEHLSKPIDPGELYAVLRQWLPVSVGPQPNSNENTPTSGFAFNLVNGLDVNMGLKRVGGNHQLYVSLLQKLMFELRDLDSKLLSALNENRTTDVLRHVHSIKSVAGQLGATQLQEHAARLERLIRNDEGIDEQSMGGLLRVVKNLYAALSPILMQYMQEISNNKDEDLPQGSLQDYKDLLIELRDAIESRKPIISRDILSKLTAKKWASSNTRQLIERLNYHIDNYNFKGAMDAVKEILDTL